MEITYIYVKQLPNGLYYLGKTIKDPIEYKGSGTYWLRVIKKYNYKLSDIKTWILHKTTDKNDIKIIGEYYSKLFDVVNSKNWANLKPENGDGGQGKGFMKNDPNHPVKRKEVREKISKTLLGESNWIRGKIGKNAPMYGYKHTDESKQKIRDAALKLLNKKQVNQYDLNNNFIKSWDSITQAEKTLNIHHISSVCSGKRNYAGGFIWKYKN
jgi:hypothetical protein